MSQLGLQLLILHLLSGIPLVMAAKTMAWECSEIMNGLNLSGLGFTGNQTAKTGLIIPCFFVYPGDFTSI